MMGTEDGLPGFLGDEEDEMDAFLAQRYEMRHQKLATKNKAALSLFLGRGRRVHQVGIVPRYYGELLTWALKRYMEKEGWQTVQTLGYQGKEPIYIDVNTGCGQRENLLMNGQVLAEKGKKTSRLIITVAVNPRGLNSILTEGPAKKKEEVHGFVAGVLALSREQNFYRGKKLEFSGGEWPLLG
jgi:hypothetical protein